MLRLFKVKPIASGVTPTDVTATMAELDSLQDTLNALNMGHHTAATQKACEVVSTCRQSLFSTLNANTPTDDTAATEAPREPTPIPAWKRGMFGG